MGVVYVRIFILQGTKVSSKQLEETCQEIINHNPRAIIILDSVVILLRALRNAEKYIRTLLKEDAKELLSKIVNREDLLKNIVFLESFSKSHGLCRERLGLYFRYVYLERNLIFSMNEKLFTKLHSTNVGFSAGPGYVKGKRIAIFDC